MLGVQKAQHSPYIDTRRQQTIATLWNITETLNVLYKDNWTLLANKEITKFQADIIQTLQHDLAVPDTTCPDTKHRRERELSITAAFLYCLSLITTIGKCGNILTYIHLYGKLA